MPTNREIVVAPVTALRERFRTVVREAARRASAEGRRFSIAVSGGSVVTHLLAALQGDDADWGLSDVFWCDERAVAPTVPESNYAASVAGWLGGLSGTGVRLHRMAGEDPSLEAAARRYEAELVASLGDPPRLDVAVVGVGEDGHICSLFPGHAALIDAGRMVLAVHDAPKPPPGRLTLTLPVVAGARWVVVGAFGRSKHDAVRAALDDAQSALPVARLLQLSANTVVLLDEDAGHGWVG